ncbi:MAG: hypothetical protein NPINA01_29700 [Nitrospinaceae bacterium]|nr:MAG: hypothetical protein NPINA01_29700 [Nitrospinaceae bacterium]
MKCPKCGHEQTSNPTCIQCGIVFSKYYEIQNRKAKSQVDHSNEPLKETSETVFGRIRQLGSLPWQPVSTPAMAALSAGFAIMVYLLASKNVMGSDSTILYFVHNVNLVFHEAGHWIFGVFGNRILAIFGGSLNQVLVPAMVAAAFWAKRDAVGFAFGLFWCFENLLDIAVYMADSRALVLPLIGGMGEDGHDWRNLFFRFGLIEQDTAIAAKTRFVGWVGIIATWTWFLWRGVMDRQSSYK